MHFATVLALVLGLGCSTTTGWESVPVQQSGAALAPGQVPFPPPERALRVPHDPEGTSVAMLLQEFSEATGQILFMDANTRQIAEVTQVSLTLPAEVPPEEVYTFVESILSTQEFVLCRLKAGDQPLLGVYSLGASTRGGSRFVWTLVESEDLPRYRAHPALLIQTLVSLPNTDVRQVSTSLRGMLHDTNTQTLIAAGEHDIILRGRGRFVADLAAMLLESDENQRRAREERAKEAEQAAERRDATSGVAGEEGGR